MHFGVCPATYRRSTKFSLSAAASAGKLCCMPSSSAGCPEARTGVAQQPQSVVRQFEFMDAIRMCHAARLQNADLAVPLFVSLLDRQNDPGVYERRHTRLGLLGLV